MRGAIAACLLLVFSSSIAAQQPDPESLRGRLQAFGFQAGDVLAEQQISGFAALTAIETSTAPFGTSTGGFTYRYDPQLRIFVRSTETFGPAFAQRAATAGKGKLSAGFNWLHANYSTIGGQSLKNGELLLIRNARLVGSPLSSLSDTATITTDTSVGFVSVGVTDTLDLSLVVPFISVADGGTATAFTASGLPLASFTLPRVSASGLGDMAVSAKYRAATMGRDAFAGELQVRFPTGKFDDLRGLGITRTLLSGIWSRSGRISPHANLGYEFWSGDVEISASGFSPRVSAKDQVHYAAGIELAAHPRATITVDVVGRYLRHAGAIGYQSVSDARGTVEALLGLPKGYGAVSLAPGIKWNVYRSALFTASLLTSVHNDGLRARFVPVLGVDWAF